MLTEQKKRAVDFFNKGRNLYKLMKFSEALDVFTQALKVDPTDGPSMVYQERCQLYLDEPPPGDWDGVFVMKTK